MSFAAHIRTGFALVNRTPGLIALKLLLCLLLPAALLFLFYAPALGFLYSALEAMASPSGIRGALLGPEKALSDIAGPFLLYMSAFFLCAILALLGMKLAEAVTVGALSASVIALPSRGRGEPGQAGSHAGLMRMGRGLMRPIALYSFLETLVLMGILAFFALAAAIVSAATSGLESSRTGLFAAVALWSPVALAFIASVLCLRCLRLRALAYMGLEGRGAPEAFRMALRSLWQRPGTADFLGLLLTGYALLQPVMALAAWGFARLPVYAAPAFIVWCIVWASLDMYLWMVVIAAALVAHNDAKAAPVFMGPAAGLTDVFGAVESGELRAGLDEGLKDVWSVLGQEPAGGQDRAVSERPARGAMGEEG